MLAHPIDYFLILSRPKNDWSVAATIAFESTNKQETETKLKELVEGQPLNMFKIETWTKVR